MAPHTQNTVLRRALLVILGNAVLAFGLYNIHAVAGITEGGVLGLMLLLNKHFSISPARSEMILDTLCYAFGFKVLGLGFIGYSAVAIVSFSGVYSVLECFPPLFPAIADHPLIAAITGAVFVGVGAGISVRAGGASGGDDALAMSIDRLTHIGVEKVYLISDVTVLLLSLTYIPPKRIVYSLITVVLSGQIIGFIQKINKKTDNPHTA